MPDRDVEGPSLRVRAGQPLIGVVVSEQGETVTRYFTTRPGEMDTASNQRRVEKASRLAGVWKDLDWSEMEQALDRIRHESKPTPPIDQE